MKICKICEKDETLSDFEAGRAKCRTCVNNQRKAFRITNRDRLNKTRRDRREVYKVAEKAWKESNPNKVLTHRKTYRENHPENHKSWVVLNPNKVKEYDLRKRVKRNAVLASVRNDLTSVEIAEVWEEHGGICFWCGVAVATTLEHIIPLIPRKGDLQGSNTKGNVVPSCKPCNNRKHNKDPLLFLFELRRETT